MSDNNLVSVIIPVYDVEKHISECLDSVINQTYQNLEILCVNDCSPDNSAKILINYAEKDSRIKIIQHERNQGLSGARNTGLANADGKYIYFLDGDDFIDLKYIEVMVNALEENTVDIVINNKIVMHKDGKCKKLWPFNYFAEGFRMIDHSPFLFPSMAWCKLYRKSFLDKIQAEFPVGLKHEDHYFDATTLIFTNKVFIVNNPTYYYRQREDSIMGEHNTGIKNYDMINISKRIYSFYLKNNLLNKYKIDLLILKYQLEAHVEKELFLGQIRDYFKSIKNEIFKVQKLYSPSELEFLNNIIKSDNYNEFLRLQNKKTYKLYLFDLIPVVVKKEIR